MLQRELRSFDNIWQGGYYEGDPLDPMGQSAYGEMGYLSVLYATYLLCIKPYVSSETIVLEIGPGRGAWTKTMLHAREVWCLDALSAEHNGFWSYVGRQPHVRYEHISDFSCSVVPDGSVDFLFSFGCFPHISPEGIAEYMRNLYSKLRPGAHGFISFADYDKLNWAYRHIDRFSVSRTLPRKARHILPLAMTWDLFWRLIHKRRKRIRYDVHESQIPYPGRWWHMGTGRMAELLSNLGYTVVEPDIGVLHRDPMIHFTK
jgi:hypothetical protein